MVDVGDDEAEAEAEEHEKMVSRPRRQGKNAAPVAAGDEADEPASRQTDTEV